MGAIIVREEFPRGDSAALIGPAVGGALHVASFNVRGPRDAAPHGWPDRRELVRRLWVREWPTVLSTQEAMFHQARDLKAMMDGYDMIHLSRLGGGGDESTAIVFDARRLTPLDYAHLWLSDTPTAMGSATWGNDIPRMLTWARFADRLSGKEFVVLNTHLDHVSVPAQDKAAHLLRRVVADLDVPAIVTGDFNVPPDATVHKTLVADGPLADAWDAAATRLSPPYATFHAWEPEPRLGDRIDWILTTPGVSVTSIGVNTWSHGGLTPSDHWPLQALMELG
ncbi:MAG TPA: endonuclease/exonuclease/phosphatase family protein [Stackebrandtia sp.]|uniref:endonuclease/exonuclease/phosphatase family protein n=1 Tax=Stackebrandtia sp. TaxID=2023065 RepID=UPI002D4F660C|nr:endonuclease/exonuclease/phosphatase family protein [Stackebrandtia sp.]HZE41092.1 endonuclease/exonuclease/phosphatase family protein [Stackebrandtia sp.]